MESKIINSITELLNYTYTLNPLCSNYRYRGQSIFDWSLQPSVYRFQNFKRYQTMFFEEILLSQKPSVPYPPILNTTLNLEWLMLSQHYNVPTRFLDWSSDVLTSLYFACNENFNEDGSIFICNQSDYQTIPNINHDPMEIQELVFINTNIINPRLRAQSGSFMVWGHSPLNNDKSRESYDLWEYYENNKTKSHFIEKLKIPKSSKKQILNELDIFYNINQNSLYLGGNIERNLSNNFEIIKNKALKFTLFITDSDKLSIIDKEIIRQLIPNIGENCFGGCESMKSMKGLIRL